MSKFTFHNVDDTGVVATIEFESETWLDAFPHFLNLCRASGFVVDTNTRLYAPTASETLFDDRDFLLFDSDLKESDDNTKHSGCYYDSDRNQ